MTAECFFHIKGKMKDISVGIIISLVFVYLTCESVKLIIQYSISSDETLIIQRQLFNLGAFQSTYSIEVTFTCVALLTMDTHTHIIYEQV